MKKKIFYCFIKRLLDIFFSLLGILICLLPMIIIGIIIKIDSKGPVMFTQRRIGKNKKEFKILKFRTLKVDAPHDLAVHLLTNLDEYTTKYGKFLRKSSLDELPQLFNIFVGQMSFVGPRPALYNQYDLIEFRDKNYSNFIKPGLTGYAQINGRNDISNIEKANLDGEYVLKRSLLFDASIFLKTIFHKR